MKKLRLLGLLLGLCYMASAQVLRVQEQETGQALELATIASENPKAMVTTDASGQADVSAFKGAEKIDIRLLGYTAKTYRYAELEAAQFVVLLAASNISLDQIVVSATRWKQNKRDIPAKISSIGARDVALQNPQTAADMLGGSGEVFIQKSQQGGGSPMIRGFSTNRLLYTIDGVRMNTAIFRSGNLQNVISIDPFAIENTEIFFGPGSIIYGSDAIGGVMSFQTLTPRLSSTDKPLIAGKAVTRHGSANQEKTGHADFQVGWKKWAMASSFTSADYGDLRMGTKGPEEYLKHYYIQRQDNVDVVVRNDDPLVQRPTAYAQINLMQKIRFTPNERWDFQYGFHYSTTSSYSRYDRLLRLRNGLPRSAEWSYGPQVWQMHHLNVAHQGNNAWYDQMTLRLAHQFLEESRIDRDLNRTIRFNRVEKVDALSANLDFLKLLGTKYRFYYGVEAVVDQVHSTGTDENVLNGTVVEGPSRYPQSDWSSYAAYLNGQVKFSDKWLFQAGVRYSHFVLNADFSNNLAFYPFPYSTARINKGALTGSIGFVYDPAADWSLSANASTGFRSPNVDDLGKVFDSEPGFVLVPNPSLGAEYAYNAEMDVAKVFGDAVKIDLAVFYTVLNNALVRRNFTLNGRDSILYAGELSQVQAIQNAARTTVYGFQAGLEVKLAGGFRFSSQFNVQKGEEELDNGDKSPARHAAPWFGTSRLTYAANKLNMQVYLQYSGEVPYSRLPEEGRATDYIFAVDANGNPYYPGWYTLNYKAMYQFAEHLSLSAGVENLTDQRYRPYSSGLVAPGRNFILSLRANF